MLVPYVLALKDSIRTLMLIGALATGGAAVLILGLGMDTPWAPWERDSDVMFPPVLFTLATFVATVAFCAGTVVYHTFLKSITIDADKWWRISGSVFCSPTVCTRSDLERFKPQSCSIFCISS